MNNIEKTFTVVDTETQKTTEFKSFATTFGELKQDLINHGFNMADKTVQEALTRTELKDDNSLLPHDVPYKGNITNDLVFRLTKTSKKVNSGADRAELYNIIKKNNWQDEVKTTYGKNFTQCSTALLSAFIQEHEVKKTSVAKKASTNCTSSDDKLSVLCKVLLDKGLIDEEEFNSVISGKLPEVKKTKYSKNELANLINF